MSLVSPQFNSPDEALTAYEYELQELAAKHNVTVSHLQEWAEHAVITNDDYDRVRRLTRLIGHIKSEQRKSQELQSLYDGYNDEWWTT